MTIEERNALVVEFLPQAKRLASSVARRMRMDPGELYGAAAEGLMRAAEKFRPELGYKFWTYAGWKVRGVISDYLREASAVPRTYCKKIREVELQDHHGVRDKDPDEFVEGLGRGLNEQERTMLQLRYVNDLTMREIGLVLGITESRVSQIFTRLHRRLVEERRVVCSR